jgi:hypothetical protein
LRFAAVRVSITKLPNPATSRAIVTIQVKATSVPKGVVTNALTNKSAITILMVSAEAVLSITAL